MLSDQPETADFKPLPIHEYDQVVRGISIHFRAVRPTVAISRILLLHGLGGHSGYYESFAQFLGSHGIGVILYDRRGHGSSEGVRGDITDLNSDLDDLSAIVSSLQTSNSHLPFSLLGESWGALLLLQYASSHPDITMPVILASPPISVRITPAWCMPAIKATLEVLRNLGNGVLAARSPAPFPLEHASRDPLFVEKIKSDPTTNREMTLRSGLNTMRLMMHATANAERILAPILVLIGDKDYFISLPAARRLVSRSPNPLSSLVEYPGAFHTLYWDPVAPSAAAAIAQWLGRVEAFRQS
jgi:alpha-beta hydrolase superfamily lysophospholipase